MKKKKYTILSIDIRSRKKLIKFFIYVLAFFSLIFLIMWYLVNPILVKTGKSKITEISNIAMNYAVSQVMKENISYDDLVHIVTDSSGKISMIQANSIQINSLSRNIIDVTYAYLFEKIDEPLTIPFGSFTGIPIFSTLGPEISINILPYGSVDCVFLSKFVSSGINQTNHKIYLSIKTSVNVVMPLTKLFVENKSDILLCESLIIGEVPNTYLMASEVSDMLNVVGE